MVSPNDASIKQIADFVSIQKLDRSVISGEVYIETTQQITKPFIKKHFRTATFPTDTDVKSGDLLIREHQRYLLIELSEKFNQRELLYRDGVAYKTNFSGEIQRITETKGELGNTVVKSVIEQDVYGILGSTSDFLNPEIAGDIETGRWGMWLPANVSGEIGDIAIVNSGEVDRFQAFRIETVNPGVDFDGVNFISMDLDTVF